MNQQVQELHFMWYCRGLGIGSYFLEWGFQLLRSGICSDGFINLISKSLTTAVSPHHFLTRKHDLMAPFTQPSCEM